MRSLLAAILLAASCGSDAGGLLVVTVDATGRVPAVASFRVVATNGSAPSSSIAIPVAHGPADIPPAQTFALAFDASRSGAVHVAVDALGADGATIASGTGDATITPGQETMATVLLAGVTVGDMGGDAAVDGAVADFTSIVPHSDGALPDLATPDLAVPDLAVPDLAVPDLAVPDLAPCGVCMPGAQRTIACGNCGVETDTCTSACAWATGACSGQGACAPGATQGGGCDQCSQQTCGSNCQWSACTLKSGNACEYKNGTNTRACACGALAPNCGVDGSGKVRTQGSQMCSQSCQWDAWGNQCVCGCNACSSCPGQCAPSGAC